MNHRFWSSILAALALLSCHSNLQKTKRNNEITKVCFASGRCMKGCPALAIEIDSSLSYKYYGDKDADIPGYYIGKVTEGFWDTLNIKFEKVKYEQLDSLYSGNVDDMPTEVIIYFNNKKRKIVGESGRLPDSLRLVYDWLADSPKKMSLSASSVLEFETSVQIPPPPIPLVNTIHFIKPVRTPLFPDSPSFIDQEDLQEVELPDSTHVKQGSKTDSLKNQ